MAHRRRLSIAGGGALALSARVATTSVALNIDATSVPSAKVALQRRTEREDAAMRDLGGQGVSSQLMAAAPAVIPAELCRPVTWS